MGRKKKYPDCPFDANSKEYHHWFSKKWYESQTKEQLQERNKYRAVVRNRNKLEAIKVLGGKCNDCNSQFPHYVYDFHHIDGDKKTATLNKLLNCSLETVLEEIKNCVLLCANCHRMRHKAEHNRKSRTQNEIYGE